MCQRGGSPRQGKARSLPVARNDLEMTHTRFSLQVLCLCLTSEGKRAEADFDPPRNSLHHHKASRQHQGLPVLFVHQPVIMASALQSLVARTAAKASTPTSTTFLQNKI